MKNQEKINIVDSSEKNIGNNLEQQTTSINENERRYEKVEKSSLEKNKNINELSKEAFENASEIESNVPKKIETTVNKHEKYSPSLINKKQKDKSFDRTMGDVQKHMPLPKKVFSKIIHNKIIEKTSDVAASTVARPNAILSGSVCASILTLCIYVIAKRMGYPLSGFETIAAFSLGWIIGLAYDFIKNMITGKNN